MEGHIQTIEFDDSQADSLGCQVLDIGKKSVEKINKIERGHLFLLGETAIVKPATKVSDSLSRIIKNFFKR